ncbi:MAG: hypothetical protein LBF59_02570 [Prevotellaceae bacterium]|jgi:hypothetical protein|nr:hypothetical protein [Prevotellaceae bacterium]
MASIRNLKKDIVYLVSEVISDSQLFILLNPKQNDNKAYSVIEDAVDMYNLMIQRANHPDGKDNPKLVKQHYRTLRADLLSQTHNLFERISKLKD